MAVLTEEFGYWRSALKRLESFNGLGSHEYLHVRTHLLGSTTAKNDVIQKQRGQSPLKIGLTPSNFARALFPDHVYSSPSANQLLGGGFCCFVKNICNPADVTALEYGTSYSDFRIDLFQKSSMSIQGRCVCASCPTHTVQWCPPHTERGQPERYVSLLIMTRPKITRAHSLCFARPNFPVIYFQHCPTATDLGSSVQLPQ